MAGLLGELLWHRTTCLPWKGLCLLVQRSSEDREDWSQPKLLVQVVNLGWGWEVFLALQCSLGACCLTGYELAKPCTGNALTWLIWGRLPLSCFPLHTRLGPVTFRNMLYRWDFSGKCERWSLLRTVSWCHHIRHKLQVNFWGSPAISTVIVELSTSTSFWYLTSIFSPALPNMKGVHHQAHSAATTNWL